MSIAEARLRELGLELPQPAKPLASYVPWVRTGNLVFISGQLPMRNGQVTYVGKVGQNFTIEEGIEAAQLCAVNVLAQLRDACGGDLDKVRSIVKITGYVNSAPEFFMHPAVVNGASDLFVAVYGEIGRHARAAVGCQLPLNAAVEVEAVVEVA